MNIKQATMEYIDKETKEFLEMPFVLDPNNFGGLSHAKENPEVNLIYAPDWEKWIEAMYYTAFATWNNGCEINLETKTPEQRKKLTINFLKKRPISAVLESAIFVLKLDNIPRSMTHQLVRHRGMAFNQESYRVTPAHHADVRIPEGLSLSLFAKTKEVLDATKKLYIELINSGIPIEQARNVLPMGTCTHIVMTSNLKVLQDYLKARTLDITQDEHTYLVMLICKEIKNKAPLFWEHFFKSEKLESLMQTYEVK